MRGEVYELRRARDARGHEQRGRRFGVVVQSSDLDVLSTWLVAPTSTSARSTSFRPEVTVAGRRTLVLCEQTTALNPQRLGRRVDLLGSSDQALVDEALRLVLDLL